MIRAGAAAMAVACWLASSAVAGAAPAQRASGGYPSIQAAELAKKIASNRNGAGGLFWVDLRNEADFKRGFIPGSINIPFKKLSFLAEKFFSRSDDVVFISYPDSDHVSVNAVIFMKNKGFSRCSVLEGGIGAWTGDLETAAPNNPNR